MELVLAGITGKIGSSNKPLLVIDPLYANYKSFAQRLGRKIVSIERHLNSKGEFEFPKITQIQKVITKYKPNAILVIPYDNPTGQHYQFGDLVKLSKLAVKNNMWIVSDEAYRELYYTNKKSVSIWSVTNKYAPGIIGRRIAIESASKVWNACGLRIGAIVTDNKEFHEKCVAEQTANLCANTIGQYVYSGLLEVSKNDLKRWFVTQRQYYKKLIDKTFLDLMKLEKRLIVSLPESSIYSVIDVKGIVDDNFNAADFVSFCASKGKVKIGNKYWTLLVSPMSGFYNSPGLKKKALTQMRIAYVENRDKVQLIPELLLGLINQYLKTKK